MTKEDFLPKIIFIVKRRWWGIVRKSPFQRESPRLQGSYVSFHEPASEFLLITGVAPALTVGWVNADALIRVVSPSFSVPWGRESFFIFVEWFLRILIKSAPFFEYKFLDIICGEYLKKKWTWMVQTRRPGSIAPFSDIVSENHWEWNKLLKN